MCPVAVRTNTRYPTTGWVGVGTIDSLHGVSVVHYGTSEDTCGQGADVGDAPHTGDLDLDAVITRYDLASLLRTVRIRADNPALRTLEARTRHSQTPLSKTAVQEMLNGVRFPRKAVMIAFLQACGVPDDRVESWQRMWDRVASREAEPPAPETRRAPRGRLGQATAVQQLGSHREGSMPLAQPAPLRLAQRLRNLRQQQWPEMRLTQAALARGLGSEESLSAATVSSWESPISPKLPPHNRVLAYARFFATRRSVEADSPHLLSLDLLTDDERDAYEALKTELLALRDAATNPPAKDEAIDTRSWRFSDSGPLTVICAQLPERETGSLARPDDPNYTELLSYADLDALIELYGHIRAENPTMDVFYKLSSKVVPNDMSSHVVILGGIGWNDKTQRLSEMTSLPVRQIEDPEVQTGEIFVLERDGGEERFLPRWGGTGQTLVEDVGLIVRTPNPLNSNRSLTICNGVHSRGVLGAVRALTDARLRESNERYIVDNFVDPSNFAILMRVSVIAGQAMTPDFRAADCVRYKWPEAEAA